MGDPEISRELDRRLRIIECLHLSCQKYEGVEIWLADDISYRFVKKKREEK